MCRRLFLSLLLSLAHAEPKRIALTFDDAPNKDTFLTGSDRATRLLAGLKKGGVPQAAFFVNSIRMDAEGRRRLRRYAAAGHLIANHTHSHPELNVSSARSFMSEVATADAHLSELPGFRRWFRFPYLREGETPYKRDKVREALDQLGYRNAYITVNTYDWYLDVLYQRALHGGEPLHGFLRTYVETIVHAAEYYDKLARDMLKRSPAHVLLLHENDLNAVYVMELVHALRGAGWQIISPEEAYQDPIAQYLTPNAWASNPGRIGELAMDRGINQHPWHEGCNELFLEKSLRR